MRNVMMRICGWLATAMLLAGVLAPMASARADNGVHDDSCDDFPGAADIMHGHRIVMVGEHHGTREMPAVFGRLVCNALRRGNTVAVGLELAAGDAAPLADYLAADGGTAARARLLSGTTWRSPHKDGRQSEAMLRLIERLRVLQQGGAPLEVFVLTDRIVQDYREVGGIMAQAVRRRFASAARPLVVTLTGNVHSGTNPPAPGRPEPMGYLLTDLRPVSVRLLHDGGQAWNCRTGCGVHELARTSGDQPLLALQPDAAGQAVTRQVTLRVGPVSASPPADSEAAGSAR